MFTAGGFMTMLALLPIKSVATTAASIALVFGVVLLFFGVKLVRVIFTLVLTVIGAVAGTVVAGVMSSQGGEPAWAWAAPIIGAVVFGLLGFLLCKIWIIVMFGATLAALAGGGYLFAMARGDLDALRPRVGQICNGMIDTMVGAAQLSEAIDKFQSDKSEITPEDREKLKGVVERVKASLGRLQSGYVPMKAEDVLSEADIKLLNEMAKKYKIAQDLDLANRLDKARDNTLALLETGEKFMDLFRKHGLGMSIAAAVGLMIGLLLGALSWKLAAVIVTSLLGLKLVILGALVLVLAHQRELMDKVGNMGWKAWLGPAGLWLMGVSVQAMLARKKKNADDVEHAG